MRCCFPHAVVFLKKQFYCTYLPNLLVLQRVFGFDIHLQVYQFFNFNSQYCLPLFLKRCLIRKFHQLSKAYSLDVVNYSHYSKYQKNIKESRNYELNVAVSDPGINFIPVVTIHSTSMSCNFFTCIFKDFTKFSSFFLSILVKRKVSLF